MMKAVLFNSARPLGRCENITAVWNAYDGPKRFLKMGYGDISAYKQDIIVTDEFVRRADKPRQTIVMIAHGLTGGKVYGADQRHGQFNERSCLLTDWYIVSSEYGIPVARTAAGRMPIDQILPLGMPRTDVYFGKSKGDGGTGFDRFARVYLYVPTFRSRYNEPRPVPDWEAIDALMEDDELMVVKRHVNSHAPFLKREMDHMVEVDNMEPSTPYLIDCDVVISDYSSIIFDGYILGRPSVLIVDDMESYLKLRGMYHDFPDWYSSRRVEVKGNPEGLLEQCRAACVTGMRGVENACREKTAGACDGHSAQRVADFVKGLACES